MLFGAVTTATWRKGTVNSGKANSSSFAIVMATRAAWGFAFAVPCSIWGAKRRSIVSTLDFRPEIIAGLVFVRFDSYCTNSAIFSFVDCYSAWNKFFCDNPSMLNNPQNSALQISDGQRNSVRNVLD